MQGLKKPVHAIVAALGIGLFALGSMTVLADCDIASGPRTAALVELYTSQGCSSCPPADRQLGELTQLLDRDAEVVPIALHVDYWDELGWQDRYAQPVFDERQRRLVTANGQNTVYTPQFFVAGREVRSWPAQLAAKVRDINALPAAASLRVRAQAPHDDTLSLRIDASGASDNAPTTLYLALAESGLTQTIAAGENGGRTLAHDHVVRSWSGPFAVTREGLHLQRALPLAADWKRDRLEVVVFVQDSRNGQVLQALRARQCAAS